MDRRYFVLFFSAQFFVLLVILAGWVFFAIHFSRLSKDALNNVDNRIENIVMNTLLKVREDIGILTPSSSQDEQKKQIKVEGANLSTFEHHFYIDNTPFFIGDVISPYGMAIQVGRDCVIFDDLNGGIIVLGKNLPQVIEPKKEPDKNNSVVGERA